MEVPIAALSSPGPELFTIGPFVFRWYGILIAFSVYIGLNISNTLSYYKNLTKGLINDLMPILILCSVIGARFYYVIFEWRNYSGENFWGSLQFLGLNILFPRFLEIWNGGIAIHGALIFGLITLFIFCRIKKESFWDVLDVLVPSVILGQAIGRWGNFFNNEAFGLPTNLPWKLFIPYTSRPSFFSNESFFHPTFLYESVWNFCIFFFLIFLFRSSVRGFIKLPPGSLSCIYFISYSFGRFWIESLRIDPLCIGSLPPSCEGGIRVAQIISLILFTLGTYGLCSIYQRKRQMPRLGIKTKKEQ